MKINVYTDGGSRGNPGPAGAAFLIYDEEGSLLDKGGVYIGTTSNNVAEYRAVTLALRWLIEFVRKGIEDKILNVNFHLDSALVVNQLSGTFRVKNKSMGAELFSLRSSEQMLIRSGEKNGLQVLIHYEYIPREQNQEADGWVNQILNEHPRRGI